MPASLEPEASEIKELMCRPLCQITELGASVLTPMIKIQQGSLAIKLNSLSNHSKDTKRSGPEPYFPCLTLLLWPSCSPAAHTARTSGWPGPGAGTKGSEGTHPSPQLPRTDSDVEEHIYSTRPFSSSGPGWAPHQEPCFQKCIA